MGWDRPLQGFFLVISRVDARKGEGEYVYSNLKDLLLAQCGGLPPTLDYFRRKLAWLGITVPARVLAEIERDALANVGSRYVTYGQDGCPVTSLAGDQGEQP
jgi:hypothetical protein